MEVCSKLPQNMRRPTIKRIIVIIMNSKKSNLENYAEM